MMGPDPVLFPRNRVLNFFVRRATGSLICWSYLLVGICRDVLMTYYSSIASYEQAIPTLTRHQEPVSWHLTIASHLLDREGSGLSLLPRKDSWTFAAIRGCCTWCAFISKPGTEVLSFISSLHSQVIHLFTTVCSKSRVK